MFGRFFHNLVVEDLKMIVKQYPDTTDFEKNFRVKEIPKERFDKLKRRCFNGVKDGVFYIALPANKNIVNSFYNMFLPATRNILENNNNLAKLQSFTIDVMVIAKSLTLYNSKKVPIVIVKVDLNGKIHRVYKNGGYQKN